MPPAVCIYPEISSTASISMVAAFCNYPEVTWSPGSYLDLFFALYFTIYTQQPRRLVICFARHDISFHIIQNALGMP